MVWGGSSRPSRHGQNIQRSAMSNKRAGPTVNQDQVATPSTLGAGRGKELQIRTCALGRRGGDNNREPPVRRGFAHRNACSVVLALQIDVAAAGRMDDPAVVLRGLTAVTIHPDAAVAILEARVAIIVPAEVVAFVHGPLWA